MALVSFCGILTLQVGVAVLAAVFFTLSGVILAANIFSYENIYDDGWPLSLTFMIIFVVGLIIAGSLMFISSYAENRSLAMTAMMVIIILFFYWVILCCFSFVSTPSHIKKVCVFVHCPESFWIANLAYRTMHHEATTDDKQQVEDFTESKFNSKKKRSLKQSARLLNASLNQDKINHVGYESLYRQYDIYSEDNKEKFKTDKAVENVKFYNEKHNIINIQEKDLLHNILNQRFIRSIERSTAKNPKTHTNGQEEKSRYRVDLPLFGAIVLFLINCIFLLFTICVMWSWASELNWTDYYIEDEPVVIYEDGY